jgi:hypothetical protein
VLATDPVASKRTVTWKRLSTAIELWLPGVEQREVVPSLTDRQSDALSESGVATLVRLRGRWRLRGFAGASAVPT